MVLDDSIKNKAWKLIICIGGPVQCDKLIPQDRKLQSDILTEKNE